MSFTSGRSLFRTAKYGKETGVLANRLTSRAIHIEVDPSLETSFCVMGVERFIARRGTPSTILSDNGTNFPGAQKELLVESWNKHAPAVLSRKGSSGNSINPEHRTIATPGSDYVRSVKRVLNDILGNRRVDE